MSDFKIAARSACFAGIARFDELFAAQCTIEIFLCDLTVFQNCLVFQHALADFDLGAIKRFHDSGMDAVETGISVLAVEREDGRGSAFQHGGQCGVALGQLLLGLLALADIYHGCDVVHFPRQFDGPRGKQYVHQPAGFCPRAQFDILQSPRSDLFLDQFLAFLGRPHVQFSRSMSNHLLAAEFEHLAKRIVGVNEFPVGDAGDRHPRGTGAKGAGETFFRRA